MAEAVCVPAHLALPGSLQAKQLHHLHALLELGQSFHRQKKLASMPSGLFWSCPTRCIPVDCGLPGFSVREGVVLQARYWSVLANTGCRILLEHYISCCPSRQLPGVPAAARTPVTQAAAHLHTWPSQGQTQVLQGSLRNKPQGTIHMQRQE